MEHFFWHWIETKEVLHDFGGYAARYEEELRRIMDAYCEALEKGELISVVHINELLLYLLTGRKRRTTGCGVEVEGNYDIMGGRIYTCADMPMASAIGTIEEDGTPLLDKGDLSPFISYKDDLGCYQCGVHAYCGGRCPVQGLSSGAERLIQYCQLMRLHVGTVIDYLPRITEIMACQAMPLRRMYDESALCSVHRRNAVSTKPPSFSSIVVAGCGSVGRAFLLLAADYLRSFPFVFPVDLEGDSMKGRSASKEYRVLTGDIEDGVFLARLLDGVPPPLLFVNLCSGIDTVRLRQRLSGRQAAYIDVGASALPPGAPSSFRGHHDLHEYGRSGPLPSPPLPGPQPGHGGTGREEAHEGFLRHLPPVGGRRLREGHSLGRPP